MNRLWAPIADWIDSRTGFRRRRHGVLHEPLPAGTGWWFTLGGLLLFGLFVQAATGVWLAGYYAPTPGQAWDSVRDITTGVRGGAFLRGLHYWGASLVAVAAVLHLVRVVFFGSYRAPREVTWIVGLMLLDVILGLGLTGALLPWDQRAYWSMTALFGAPALTPWYALHVIVLPAVLAALVIAHLSLMRRHGISGPATPRSGPSQPFFPGQARRILAVAVAAGVVLAALAWMGAPARQPPADPASSGYVLRPAWYFLALFQWLTYFPGRWAVVGSLVIPGLAIAFLALLPWLDRARTREAGPRWPVLLPFTGGLAFVATLTFLGARHAPRVHEGQWNFLEIAGASLIQTSDRCVRCHKAGGVAPPMAPGRIMKRPDWLAMHVADPEVIAAGIREAPDANQADTRAMIAALSHLRSGPPPAVDAGTLRRYLLFSRFCADCHTLDGVGGTRGPGLSHAGLTFSAATIEQRIADAHSVKPGTVMPSFAGTIEPGDIRAIAEWLAQRK